MQPNTNFGYRPPVEKDPRNWPLESVQPTQAFPSVHITDIAPFKLAQNVYMQGKIPDCVENAVCFAQRYEMWKTTNQIPNLCRRELAIKTVAMDGVAFANGTSLEVALKIAHDQGIGDAQYFPDDHTLDENTFIKATIPQQELDSAGVNKVSSYAFVTDLSANGLKNAIYQNGVVLVGIKVSDTWWTAPNGQVSWLSKDILPIRPIDPQNPEVSGHCIALYGYDTQYFYFVNWWSPSWGDGGMGWFGLNDVPEIYEGAVIGSFIKPTTPAPPDPIEVTNLLGKVKELLGVIVAIIKRLI